MDDFSTSYKKSLRKDLLPSIKGLSIQDIIDVSVLQKIQDTFTKAMGFSAVTVDRNGNEVTKPSNFQPICKLIRSTPAGLARCQYSDALGGKESFRTGIPKAYCCKSGLMDVAAPIIIEGEYLGCILCGQVMLENEREAFVKNVMDKTLPLGFSPAQIREALDKTPSTVRDRMDAAAEMLMLTANHIIEIGVANLIQKRLLREAEEKARIERALKDSQLRVLQAQINPHFLFNALSLLSYTALEEDAQKTEEIAYILSDLLRYSLRNTATTVPIEEEFEMIRLFLTLQHLRLGERFRYHIHIDEGLTSLPIPCMTLQPLVENAIVHGIEIVLRPVEIDVSARRDNERIILQIRDNGIGMDVETVRALNEQRVVPPSSDRKRPSLGLKSTIHRLEDEYGEAFTFHVESAPGKGTEITLSWPCSAATHSDNDVASSSVMQSPTDLTCPVCS